MDSPDLNTFAGRLFHARKILRNMGQIQLAKAVGVKQQAVSQWENGETAEPRKIHRIAEVLNVSYKWLSDGIGTIEDDQSEFLEIMRKIDDPAMRDKLKTEALRLLLLTKGE